MVFVMIPLSGTGAYMGAIASTIFNLNEKDSFIAISVGVLISSMIIATGTHFTLSRITGTIVVKFLLISELNIMKTTLLVSSLFIATIAFSQTDSLTIKEIQSGTVKEIFSVIKSTTTKHGEYTMYYNNVLLCKGYYYNNEKNGLWTKYYPNGSISTVGAYINGEKNGIWKFIYENNQLASISQFNHGEKTGKWVGFYMNGDTSCVMEHQPDSINSTITHITLYYQKKNSQKYQPSIKQKEIFTKNLYGHYFDDVSLYYDNGNLYQQSFFIDNKLDGPITSFYNDGKVWEGYTYDKGKLMNVNYIKSPFGDNFSNQFANGNGTIKFYNCFGALQSIIDYKNGVEDGNAIYYYSGSVSVKSKRAEGTFSAGEKTGQWNYFTNSLDIYQKITYNKDGKAFGIFYKSGGERIEANLLYGNYHGEVKEYGFNNLLLSTYTYRNGELHGKYTDDTRQLTEKGEYYFGSRINIVNFYRGEKLRESDTIKNNIAVDSSFFEVKNIDYTPPKRMSNYNPTEHSLEASFFGGYEKEAEHIAAYIQYPDAAKINKVTGTVLLEISINSFGEVTDIKLIKGIGYGCDEEAIRLIKQMPLFEPALNRGVPVESKLVRTIRFPKPNKGKEIYVDYYKYSYSLNSSQLINFENFK